MPRVNDWLKKHEYYKLVQRWILEFYDNDWHEYITMTHNEYLEKKCHKPKKKKNSIRLEQRTLL